MSDKPIEKHRYSNNKGMGLTVVVEKIDEESKRIDYKYEGQSDIISMYFDDWEEEGFVDLSEEQQPVYTIKAVSKDEQKGIVSGGGTYPVNSKVELVAMPNNGYKFVKWQDDARDSKRTIIVKKDSEFIAEFNEIEPPKYSIEVVANNHLWGSVKGTGSYESGSVIELTAIEKDGYQFVKWSDGNTDNPHLITVVESTKYMAYFEKATPKYNIVVKACDEKMGVTTGSGSFESGATTKITATAKPGFVFTRWEDGDINSNRTIIVDANKMYTAIFEHIRYRLSLDVNDISMGIAEGAGTYEKGSTVFIEAKSKRGYRFVSWNDGINENPRKVIVNANINYSAYFDVDPIAARLEQERKDEELRHKRDRLNSIISSIKIPEFSTQNVNVDLLNGNKVDALRKEGEKLRSTKGKLDWFTEAMWWVAGVDKNLLTSCKGEYNKYVGVGTMILITAIMAALSCCYALWYVFKSWGAAIPIGIVWGMAIMFIDRFITSTLHGRNFRDKFFKKGGLVRFCISLLIGIVIAAPLELKVFEDDIRSHISSRNDFIWETEKEKFRSSLETRFDEEITGLEERKQQWESIKNNAEKNDNSIYKKDSIDYETTRMALQKELENTKDSTNRVYISRKIGRLKAPTRRNSNVYDEANNAIKSLTDSITNLRKNKNEKIDDALTNEKDKFYQSHETDYTSLGIQLKQLQQLMRPWNNDNFEMATLLLILLFVFIDISPVLYKCILRNGDYEKYMDPDNNEGKNNDDVVKNNDSLLKEELFIIDKNYIHMLYLWDKLVQEALEDYTKDDYPEE
jgi:hypothetical protein